MVYIAGSEAEAYHVSDVQIKGIIAQFSYGLCHLRSLEVQYGGGVMPTTFLEITPIVTGISALTIKIFSTFYF